MTQETKKLPEVADKNKEGQSKPSFFEVFNPLYVALTKTVEQYGSKHPITIQKARETRQAVINFWGEYIERAHPGKSFSSTNLGSFGIDSTDKDRLALCEDFLNGPEHTICKWGLVADEKGENKPVLDLLTTLFLPKKERPVGDFLQFHIEIKGGTLNIECTDTQNPGKSLSDKTVSLKFELEDAATTSVNQTLLPPNSCPRLA